jgi:hypothetical protein
MAAIERTFETSGPVALVLRVNAGDVELTTTDGAQARVEVEPLNDAARELIDETRIELRGRELLVEAPGRRSVFGFRSPEFRVAVEAPSGSDARVKVVSADVDGRGSWAQVELRTASGDVRFDQVTDLRVDSASGGVELESAGGDVTVHAASGDVRLGRVGGTVSVHLASGDMSVREAAGSVDARSASGDLTVASVAAGSVELQSASGDVSVAVLRGSRVWIDAESVSGSTSSELELSDAAPRDESEPEGPLVEIRVRSVSGDVRIGRAGVAA